MAATREQRNQRPRRASANASRGSHARARAHVREGVRERTGVPLTTRLIIVAATVVFVGVAAFFIARFFDGSWAAKNAIKASIASIEESDNAVVALNEAVSSTVDEVTAVDTQALTTDSENALQMLDRAEESLAEANALDEFLDDNQRSICAALADSIEARRTMISAGEEIIAIDATIGSARAQLEQAVEKAVQADEKSREATNAANEYAKHLTGDSAATVTDANVAVNLDNEAITLIDEAKQGLSSAKDIFGDADYAAYETYFDKRAEAAQLMLEADNALVSGDFQSVGEITNKYNEADQAATEAASALPQSTSDAFSEKYTSLTEEARDTYTKAAAKAAEADALIRHYQGVSVSTVSSTQADSQSGTAVSTEGAATTQSAQDGTQDRTEEKANTSATGANSSTLSAESVVTVQ